MAKAEIDFADTSLDSSVDGEMLGMVDDGSFESAEEKHALVSQSYLEGGDEDSSSAYNFKDLGGGVTYRFVQMGDEPVSNASESPTHGVLPGAEYFVIANSVPVYGSQSGATKRTSRTRDTNTSTVTLKTVPRKRDEKRRATHNEVERRRRDKINSWITKLAALIPNSGMPNSSSKGGILAKACDHITDLTEKQKKLERLEVDNGRLVTELLKLNQELSDLRKENNLLRNQFVPKREHR